VYASRRTERRRDESIVLRRKSCKQLFWQPSISDTIHTVNILKSLLIMDP